MEEVLTYYKTLGEWARELHHNYTDEMVAIWSEGIIDATKDRTERTGLLKYSGKLIDFRTVYRNGEIYGLRIDHDNYIKSEIYTLELLEKEKR